MISWGTKFDDVGSYTSLLDESCLICSAKSKPIYKVEQSYFNLYGLSILPTGRKIYKTCSACNTRLKAKETDSNIRLVKECVPKKIKFKYVWGWIVLLPIIIGIAFLINAIKQ